MDSRQIVLVSTAGFSVLNAGISWREAKTKRLFSQCTVLYIEVGKHLNTCVKAEHCFSPLCHAVNIVQGDLSSSVVLEFLNYLWGLGTE